MKNITVVGVGLSKSTITPEGCRAIESAHVILGAPRLLEIWGDTNKETLPLCRPEEVAAALHSRGDGNYAVLVSGDTGFFSGAASIKKAFANVTFVPGISTVNAFFASLGMSWQEAAFISAHGREVNIADTVRRHRLTFCLTGNNTKELAASLCKADFSGLKTYVGENLGAFNEKIYETTASELIFDQLPPLSVLLFENNNYDNRTPWGLPDLSFFRLDSLPMTKRETRAIIMSQLALRDTNICWDIGAGTGSVTVEMALSVYNGCVWAIEQRQEAILIIEKNCAAFHLGNVKVVCGHAPDALTSLPAPDAVFIGGSGGQIDSLVKVILEKNPLSKIVISAVSPETVYRSLIALKAAGLAPEIIQISTARGKPAGDLHVMEAQNPITIVCGGCKYE